MISANIKSGDGNGNTAKVDDEGAFQVVIHPHPPILESINPLPFSQYFTDSGLESGSNDMIVDGSASPIRFFVSSSNEFDIYLKSISVQISDPGARLDRFGALGELANGVRFYYESPETGEYNLSESIKTNLDFFRDATEGKEFGTGQDAFKADISGGSGQDTYFPEIDLKKRYGLYWGLRIAKGTKGRLVYEVRDNLAGLSVFNIKGYGIRL